MNIRKNYKSISKANFCFYCSADSDELKLFLIVTIGALFLASVFIAIGAYLKGHFRNVEDVKLKMQVLEVEGGNYEKESN